MFAGKNSAPHMLQVQEEQPEWPFHLSGSHTDLHLLSPHSPLCKVRRLGEIAMKNYIMITPVHHNRVFFIAFSLIFISEAFPLNPTTGSYSVLHLWDPYHTRYCVCTLK